MLIGLLACTCFSDIANNVNSKWSLDNGSESISHTASVSSCINSSSPVVSNFSWHIFSVVGDGNKEQPSSQPSKQLHLSCRSLTAAEGNNTLEIVDYIIFLFGRYFCIHFSHPYTLGTVWDLVSFLKTIWHKHRRRLWLITDFTIWPTTTTVLHFSFT